MHDHAGAHTCGQTETIADATSVLLSWSALLGVWRAPCQRLDVGATLEAATWSRRWCHMHTPPQQHAEIHVHMHAPTGHDTSVSAAAACARTESARMCAQMQLQGLSAKAWGRVPSPNQLQHERA